MSGGGSRVGRYLKRKAALELAKRVGMAKLAVAGALACLAFVLFLALLAVLSGASASGSSTAIGEACSTQPNESSPPSALVPIYAAAAQKFELGSQGPSILAAINKVESDYGRSTLPGVQEGSNFAGAEGPMQFLQSSWEAYGVDGNGDGVKNPYDETDAVFAAAHLLHVDGAPQDWYSAVFDYNHADWYVQKVLRIARSYGPLECVPMAQLGQLPAASLERLEYVARWIQAQRIPYCWGGGHGIKPGPSTGDYCWSADGRQVFGAAERGLDCSGAVRWLLVLSGYPDPGPIASGEFPRAYPGGTNPVLTIWSNAEHVFVTIGGRSWTTSESNFRHGPGFAGHTTAGFVASHLPEL
jgi:hypothetical protein